MDSICNQWQSDVKQMITADVSERRMYCANPAAETFIKHMLTQYK